MRAVSVAMIALVACLTGCFFSHERPEEDGNGTGGTAGGAEGFPTGQPFPTNDDREGIPVPEEPGEETDTQPDDQPRFPPRSGVIEDWYESAEEYDFDSLVGMSGTGLVVSWSISSDDTGYFYAVGDEDEIAAVWYNHIGDITNASTLSYDELVKPAMGVGGIGVIRNLRYPAPAPPGQQKPPPGGPVHVAARSGRVCFT